MRRYSVPLSVCLALVVLAVALRAGPLDPPAGPISPTYKTLSEVEPRTAINATNTPGDADSLFKITQPGSYYLTGNITGVVGKHGIEIAANGVTLDLNGFDLAGVPAMGAFDGVTVGFLRNITVRNGSVRNWGGDGVDLVGTLSGSNFRVEGVLAGGNAGVGINGGNGSTITNCSANFNTSVGIAAGASSTVTNCSAVFNAGIGIIVSNGSTISNCSASQNTFSGIIAADGSTVSNCSARLNTGDGIEIGFGCTVANCSAVNNTGNGIITITGGITTNNCTISDCSASGNTLIGIRTGSGCTLTTCTANQNGGSGINTGDGGTLTNCSANQNGGAGISTGIGGTLTNCSVSSNTGNGIVSGFGCTITNCSASLNTGRGFSVANNSTVADCTVRANTFDGIQCDSACVIRGNTCSINGLGAGNGAGIHATGSDNRIEGNTCTGSDRGIDVDLGGNIIIRNICTDNTTNWDVVSSNVILVVIATFSPAVTGNSGGTAPGSTDPNANFTY